MTLVLAATPIGRPDDASHRLAAELAGADIVAAEDTRRLRRLVVDLGIEISGRVVSYFEGNEIQRTPQLIDELKSGRRVVIVTDAGMPSVSDPGFRLVVAAVDAGIEITVVPGPSAVTCAVAISGLAVDRFCFEGFLARKPADRRRQLTELANEPRTMVFFESPHRTAACLHEMAATFGGDRPATVCRELTKTYEQVKRGTLTELASWADGGVRGEVTIVVAGASRQQESDFDVDTVRRSVHELVATGSSRKDAVAAVAASTGWPRRLVYSAAHELSGDAGLGAQEQ